MKLSRRQVRRLINQCVNEASSPQYLNENIVNFNAIRKRIEKLEANPGDQDLRSKLEKDRKDLKLKASDRKHSFFKTRYREAQTLLKFLEEFLNSQDEQAKEAAAKAKAAAQELADEQQEEQGRPRAFPGPSAGGSGGSGGGEFVKMSGDQSWEYALRDCVWYTRKAGSTKEYKLGSTSTSSGKYADSIRKLNSRFPDMVSGCSLAQSTIRDDDSEDIDSADIDVSKSNEEIIEMLKQQIVYAYNAPCADYWKRFTDHIARCVEKIPDDNGRSLLQVNRDVGQLRRDEQEGRRGGHFEKPHLSVMYPDLCRGGAATAKEMYQELISACQQERELSGFPFNMQVSLTESKDSDLSRGSLYRNRYRRY